MKARNVIARHTITIIVATAIVIIGLLINWVSAVAQDAVIESTFDEMQRIGVQYQVLLANTLEESKDDLTLFAESIAENDVDGKDIVEYFKSQSQAKEFEALYYIDLDGVGVSKDNETYDFSENESFLCALKDEVYTEEPRMSEESSDVVFDLAVPVVKNNEKIAVLYCEVPVEGYFDTILENKDYEGDVFFVDDELNLIFSTSDNHIGEVVIPQEDVQEMGLENVSKAQSDIGNKQSGMFYYEYFGVPKVMVYYPVDLSNVALAMNAEVLSISGENVKAAEYFDIVGKIVYWTVVILVIYIAIIQWRTNKSVYKVAYYDPLTELPNMAKLKMDMSDILEKNRKKRYTIIVTDIENFKAINEMFGYDMGNLVLKTVKTLTDSFEEPSLIAARIGGDKFAMFAGNGFFDDLGRFAKAVTEHYDSVIPELADYGGTFKLGRYSIEPGETNFDDIMAKVNLAHLKAKATKGEFVCDYDDTLKNQVIAEADITNRMNMALANNEFKVFLQPKFSTDEDKLVGAEALVRWIEPDGKMVFPNDFIPLFERNGFIVELDKYVFENVCMTIKKWMGEGIKDINISVNCSRLNLENPFFVDGIVAISDEYNVPHEYIEVELTESTTIESEHMIERLFEDLHEHGFKTSIDDFGAGRSSLGMLKNLQVDTLKMDRSFFVGGKNAKRDDMLIDSIVKMSHNLGMYVVAEGIETAEQIKLLKSLNCDAVQGYFYDKPMSIADFEEKYHAVMEKNSAAK